MPTKKKILVEKWKNKKKMKERTQKLRRLSNVLKSMNNFRLRFITENTLTGRIRNIGGQEIFVAHAKCTKSVSAHVHRTVHDIRYSKQVRYLIALVVLIFITKLIKITI